MLKISFFLFIGGPPQTVIEKTTKEGRQKQNQESVTEDEVKKRTTEQNPSQYEIPDEIFVKLVVIWKMLQIHIIFNVSIHEFYFLAL